MKLFNLPFLRVTSLVAILFFTLNSCKSKLDENKATTLIKNTFNLPFPITRAFKFGDYLYGNGYNTFGDGYAQYAMQNFDIPGYGWLANQNFLTITPRINTTPTGYMGSPGGRLVFNLQLTDQAKPYIVSSSDNVFSMKVGEVDFVSFSTLREVNENQYEAEFVLTTSTTPFYNAYQQGVLSSDRGLNITNDTKNIRVQIFRYEKDWAISTDDIQKVKALF